MSIQDLQLEQQPLEIQNLAARMAEIEQELILTTPGLPKALIEIHKNLLQHEELVHLLDDDDIAKLHKAHEIHKQITLIVKDEKKASTRTKKKLSTNDLANL